MNVRMRCVAPILAASSAISMRGFAQQRPTSADRFAGNWLGSLATPGLSLRMALTVSREANGNLTAVMTSLDQGNAKIPATVAVHGDTLVLTMAMAHASYRAVVVGDSLHGSFVQGPALPLNMGCVAAIPTLIRPQEPKPPFPYDA